MAEQLSHSQTAASKAPQGILKKIVFFVWHFHRKLVISIIISFALLLLLVRTLSFYLETNPDMIQELLDSQFQGQMTFDAINVNTNILFPAISMHNFTFKTKQEKQLKFKSASISLNTLQSIFHWQLKIDTIAIDGVSVILRRTKKNELYVAEFQLSNAQQTSHNPGENIQAYLELFNKTNFILTDSDVYFIDEMEELPTVFVSDINFKMKNKRSRHQVALRAKLNDSDTAIDFRLDFSGQINQIRNWDGKVYGSVDNINQQTLLHFLKRDIIQLEEFRLNELNGSIKFWSSIEKGKLQSVYGELDMRDTRLSRIDNERKINFDKIMTNFKLQRGHDVLTAAGLKQTSWSLDLFDFNINIDAQQKSKKYINLKIINTEQQVLSELQIFLDHLDLREFSQVFSFFSPQDFNKKIVKVLKPKGQIENIISTLNINTQKVAVDIERYQVQADIKQFGMNALFSAPKIRNFSSRVVFNETMGRAYINSTDMKLHLKSLFRDSWPVTQLSGEFFWQQDGDGWFFGTEQLKLINPHLNAYADVNLWLSENGQTYVDLSGFFYDANVKYVPEYLPAKVMSEGLVDWLDNAFLSGWGTDGGVVFRGELDQFPYADHSGTLDILFNTKEVVLNYNEGWPLLTDISAQVEFTEKGMGVRSTHSKLFSSVSNNIQVDIDSYLKSELKLSGDITSTVNDGKQFLKQSKLVSDDVLSMLDARGDIGLNMDVMLSLDDGEADSKVMVKLLDNQYYPPGFTRKNGLVSHIKGNILVHNDSLSAKKITASIMGQAANISIKTARQARKSKDDPKIRIVIDSPVSSASLKKFNLIPESLMPIADQLSGKPKIKLGINLPNKQRKLSLSIDTDLKNLKSDLPVPFKKQAKKISSFHLSFAEIKSPASNKRNREFALLDAKISNVLSLALFIDTSSEHFKLLKGNIAFKGAQAKLPKKNLLLITGSLNDLPLDEWQSVFASQSKKNKKSSSQSVENRFSLPIQLAMKQVVLPEIKLGTKVKAASETSKNKTVQSISSKNKDNLPDDFPLINGSIERLKAGDLDLGQFIINTRRVGKNIEFNRLELKGPLLSFKGKAKWHTMNDYPQVDFDGVAEIPSFEKILIALGNDQIMRNAKLKLSAYMSWMGGLTDLSKENITGDINVVSGKGAWIEGKPGAAGRLLGLLNMNALVRRLSFDFSDVSDKGFEFDKVEADLQVNNGLLETDNFRITAPSAKILMTGNTSLVTEEFDQSVMIIPEVSGSLPLAGAAVAGPAGAAVAWVGQKLLGDQLNRVSAINYTIKGNWDKPEIVKDKINKDAFQKFKKAFGLEDNKTEKAGDKASFNENQSEYP